MVDRRDIRDNMEVYSSDGELIGRVAGFDQGAIALRTEAGGSHHVPLDWVGRTDEGVHLLHSAAMIHGTFTGHSPGPRPTQGRARIPWLIGLVFLAIAVFLLIMAFVY